MSSFIAIFSCIFKVVRGWFFFNSDVEVGKHSEGGQILLDNFEGGSNSFGNF